MTPVNELLGFSAPYLQGGKILLPLRVQGGIVTLAGSRSLLVTVAREILRVAGEGPVHASRVLTWRRQSSPRQACERAFADWQAGGITQLAACKKQRVKHGTFLRWLWLVRRRAAAAAATERLHQSADAGTLVP